MHGQQNIKTVPLIYVINLRVNSSVPPSPPVREGVVNCAYRNYNISKKTREIGRIGKRPRSRKWITMPMTQAVRLGDEGDRCSRKLFKKRCSLVDFTACYIRVT